MIEIRIIDEKNCNDIRIPNEPFELIGRVIPSYVDEKWSYRVAYADESERGEMCFPDENYRFDEMKGNSTFLGAYDGDRCIGLLILQDAWLRYAYLYDLKVAREYRRRGVASMLLQRADEVCRSRGYGGIYVVAQDNNVGACLFYLNRGFHIGGLDTNVYKGSNQEGKSDLIFYRDCE